MEKMPHLWHKIVTCNMEFSVQAKRKKRHPRPEPKKRRSRPKPLSVAPCVHKKNSAAYRCWVSGRNSSAISPKKFLDKIIGASFSPRELKNTPVPGTPRHMRTKPPVSVPSFARRKKSVARPRRERRLARRTNSIPSLLRKKHSASYRRWLSQKTNSLFVAA